LETFGKKKKGHKLFIHIKSTFPTHSLVFLPNTFRNIIYFATPNDLLA